MEEAAGGAALTMMRSLGMPRQILAGIGTIEKGTGKGILMSCSVLELEGRSVKGNPTTLTDMRTGVGQSRDRNCPLPLKIWKRKTTIDTTRRGIESKTLGTETAGLTTDPALGTAGL